MLNYEYPPLGGGAGAITQKISEGLAAKGHQVVVLTSAFPELPFIEDFGLLKIIRVDAGRKLRYRSSPKQMLHWARASISYFKKNFNAKSFDIVFANFAIPGGIVAQKIKNAFGIPYVIMSHGHDIPWFCKKEMWLFQALLYFKIKRICKSSEINFIQTEAMKANIDSFLNNKLNEKNIIIPNGWQYKNVANPNEKNKKFTIVFSARFVKQKNPMGLLKSFEILNSRGIPFEANLFGNGPMMSTMKKFVKSKSLMNCVKFYDWIERPELEKEYAKSHVFVLPSRYEAMSVSIMDALASGLFVICTDTGQNKNLIISKINGIIVPQNNPQILAESVEWCYNNIFILGNIQHTQMPETIIDFYSWYNIVNKYEQIMQKTINQKSV